MNHLDSLPTWLLTQLLRSFLPESHPWKHHFYTLKQWSQGATHLCHTFDAVFWFFLAVISFALGLFLL